MAQVNKCRKNCEDDQKKNDNVGQARKNTGEQLPNKGAKLPLPAVAGICPNLIFRLGLRKEILSAAFAYIDVLLVIKETIWASHNPSWAGSFVDIVLLRANPFLLMIIRKRRKHFNMRMRGENCLITDKQ